MSAAAVSATETRGGVRSVLLAAFFLSLMALFVKLLGKRLGSVEIVFIRSILTLIASLLLLKKAGLAIFGQRHGLLLTRGIFGFCSLSCFFYSVTQLPLAEATVIQFTNPVFTALLAPLILREVASSRIWLALGLGMAGVLAITRPALLFGGLQSPLDPRVVSIGLFGALTTAFAYMAIRRLAALEHELVIVFYFPLVSIPGSWLMLERFIWPTATEWLLLVAVAATAQTGQIYLTRGFRSLPAATGTVVLYSQVVFATAWGLLLGELPGAWTFLGAGLVLCGTWISARRSTVET